MTGRASGAAPLIRVGLRDDYRSILARIKPLGAFDVLFFHGNGRRSCISVAREIAGPAIADAVCPRAVEIVCKIAYPIQLADSDQVSALRSYLMDRAKVLLVDPRTIARRQGLSGPERRRFILRKMAEGALPARHALRVQAALPTRCAGDAW